MVRPRFSTFVRTLALLLLVWVGFDVGLHGFLVSDYAVIAAASPAVVDAAASGQAGQGDVVDHCFCHCPSIGALSAVRPACLGLVGIAEPLASPAVPHNERHPLDQPPRLAA
jgi:hypothetical protein